MDLKTLQNTPPWEWPEQTDMMLLEILKKGSPDAPDRLLAVELSGDSTVINDALAKALLAVVQNDREKDEVRGMAAIALGPALEHADMMGFEDEDDVVLSEGLFRDIQQTLRELFAKGELPEVVRRRVLEGSVRAPQSWHHEAVCTAYGSDNENWRLTAVFCMQYIAGFETEILQSLKSDDEMIHYQAVVAAGNWEMDEAWDHVAKLARTNSTDKDLRIAAIEAMATIRPQASGAILGDLMNSKDEEIADAASEALMMAEGLAEFGDDDFVDEEDE
jgi:hypothetical protein